jgi:hypothetical protein
LLAVMDAGDSLRDNVLLSQAQLYFDPVVRMQKMIEITSKSPGSDSAIAALYEIAVLKVGNWKNSQSSPEIKKTALIEARAILNKLVHDYPSSLWAQQANNLMATLPTTE